MSSKYFYALKIIRRSLYGAVVNLLDCDIVVSKFELLCYYIHFWTNTPGKGKKPITPTLSYEAQSTEAVEYADCISAEG